MKKQNLILALCIAVLPGIHLDTFAQPKVNTGKKTVSRSAMNAERKTISHPAINPAGKMEFMTLPYAYDALEPYIDKLTVELHYTKHHKSAYDNFMNAIKGTEMESMDITDIFRKISKFPMAVRNNGGSSFNHSLYWENMKPQGGGQPNGKLSESINKSFNSFDEFKKQFSDAGKNRFGSGYVWLCLDEKGKMFVCSTPNQDNPLMDIAEKKGTPLLTLDVWEHAYYLKYQNRRADYIDAFWNLVNWEEVNRRYENALKSLIIK
jgi:superoxide dismutase, Fe-Mn family